MDLAAALRFLCRSCECSVAEWNDILKLPGVQSRMTAVALQRDDADGTTVLMAAVCRPQAVSLVSTLLAQSRAIDMLLIRDHMSKTAIHHCLENIAASGKHEEAPGMQTGIAVRATALMRDMISVAPSLLYAADRDGNTPFMLAAKSNFVPCLAFFISFAPVETLDAACNHRGHRAIHFAAEAGSCDAINFMVRQAHISPNVVTEAFDDTDSNALNRDTRQHHASTPLHLAGAAGKWEAFRCLLDLGADPLRRNHTNATAIHEAVEHGDDEMWTRVLRSLPATWLLVWSGELLINAARNKRIGTAAMDDLLAAIHPNQAVSTCTQEKSLTPLLAAAEANNSQVVARLIEEGADMTLTDKDRWNALRYAAAADDVSTVNVVLRLADALLSQDACRALLSCASTTGDTPVHLAAKRNAQSVLMIFLRLHFVCDSVLTMTNSDGCSPVGIACSSNREMGCLLAFLSHKTASDAPDLTALEEAHARAMWEKLPSKGTVLGLPAGAVLPDCPNATAFARATHTNRAVACLLEVLTEEEKTVFNCHQHFPRTC